MYPFKKFLFNPPANNHYKMAGHVAPISRDFSLNQPRKNGVVHVILKSSFSGDIRSFPVGV